MNHFPQTVALYVIIFAPIESLFILAFTMFQQVYDVTKFLEDHPGGDEVLLSATGATLFSTMLALLVLIKLQASKVIK